MAAPLHGKAQLLCPYMRHALRWNANIRYVTIKHMYIRKKEMHSHAT